MATFVTCSTRIVRLSFISRPLNLSLDLVDFTHVLPFDSKTLVVASADSFLSIYTCKTCQSCRCLCKVCICGPFLSQYFSSLTVNKRPCGRIQFDQSRSFIFLCWMFIIGNEHVFIARIGYSLDLITATSSRFATRVNRLHHSVRRKPLVLNRIHNSDSLSSVFKVLICDIFFNFRNKPSSYTAYVRLSISDIYDSSLHPIWTGRTNISHLLLWCNNFHVCIATERSHPLFLWPNREWICHLPLDLLLHIFFEHRRAFTFWYLFDSRAESVHNVSLFFLTVLNVTFRRGLVSR